MAQYGSFSSLLPEGLESRSMIKRHVDKFRRRVWLRRVCYGFLLLATAGIVALVGLYTIDQVAPSNRSVLSLPTSMMPYYWQREAKPMSPPEFFIDDVIRFDTEVLVLVRIDSRRADIQFPSKESLECRYFGGVTRFAYRKALAVHHLSNDRAAVLCSARPESSSWRNHHHLHVDAILFIAGEHQGDEIRRRSNVKPKPPLQWNSTIVAYEAFPTDQDVVVFVHGINHTRDLPDSNDHLHQLQCVYGGHFDMPVIAQAQEVFRCPHPPVDLIHHFTGKKVSVKVNGHVVPSVAYYNPLKSDPSSQAATLALRSKKHHHVCACTMIYNGAKFLKEWVYYNSHLGVEKFFLYDNNSEDDLNEVVASLRRRNFNISTISWPWLKTQEAGFSHCSLMAEPECTWMLFTDIDEYFFFPNRNETFVSFIERVVKVRDPEVNGEVGQISTFCRNFGPSGLTVSPSQGVTQGYTCRLKKAERHKSLVLLSSVDTSLANVIHHFTLKPGYDNKMVRPPMAVINHYKFQVWDQFKTKFRRRAATYVADWTEDRNHQSKDRVPDLGTKPIKPADWESRYCEVHDYGLRNYVQRVFGSFGDDGKTLHLPWG